MYRKMHYSIMKLQAGGGKGGGGKRKRESLHVLASATLAEL